MGSFNEVKDEVCAVNISAAACLQHPAKPCSRHSELLSGWEKEYHLWSSGDSPASGRNNHFEAIGKK